MIVKNIDQYFLWFQDREELQKVHGVIVACQSLNADITELTLLETILFLNQGKGCNLKKQFK